MKKNILLRPAQFLSLGRKEKSALLKSFTGRLQFGILLTVLISAAIFTGCDKISDGVVEADMAEYNVKSIDSPDYVSYSTTDSTVTVNLVADYDTSITGFSVIVSYSDDSEVVSDAELQNTSSGGNNGYAVDQQFTGSFKMSKSYASGKYKIEYFAHRLIVFGDQQLIKVAVRYFNYDNGSNAQPPVLSNLVMPSSIGRGEEFIFTVTASDPNGLPNVSLVYFTLKRPDGTVVYDNGSAFFYMVDNGDSEHFGDAVAGDGIFSYKNTFGATAQTGDWTFEFYAKDKTGLTSNVITHKINVQ